MLVFVPAINYKTLRPRWPFKRHVEVELRFRADEAGAVLDGLDLRRITDQCQFNMEGAILERLPGEDFELAPGYRLEIGGDSEK